MALEHAWETYPAVSASDDVKAQTAWESCKQVWEMLLEPMDPARAHGTVHPPPMHLREARAQQVKQVAVKFVHAFVNAAGTLRRSLVEQAGGLPTIDVRDVEGLRLGEARQAVIFGDLQRDYERRVFKVTVASSAKASATAHVHAILTGSGRGHGRGRDGNWGRGRKEEAFGSDELGQRALDLLSGSHRFTSQVLYTGRLSLFAEFCHDSKNINPLMEATTATAFRYVA
eukprot:jgi/Tetstr1/421468/TSEL_012417.t1